MCKQVTHSKAEQAGEGPDDVQGLRSSDLPGLGGKVGVLSERCRWRCSPGARHNNAKLRSSPRPAHACVRDQWLLVDACCHRRRVPGLHMRNADACEPATPHHPSTRGLWRSSHRTCRPAAIQRRRTDTHCQASQSLSPPTRSSGRSKGVCGFSPPPWNQAWNLPDMDRRTPSLSGTDGLLGSGSLLAQESVPCSAARPSVPAVAPEGQDSSVPRCAACPRGAAASSAAVGGAASAACVLSSAV